MRLVGGGAFHHMDGEAGLELAHGLDIARIEGVEVDGAGKDDILLVHLAGSAWHYLGVLVWRRPALGLQRWQCLALPVFGVWAGVVALAFPPLFGFR